MWLVVPYHIVYSSWTATFCPCWIFRWCCGCWVFLTRFVFNLETVTENAFKYLQENKKLEFEENLDKIEEELNEEDREQFKIIRVAYNHYKDQLQKGNIVTNEELEEKLNNLFKACVEQLKYAHELYITIQGLSTDAKKSVLKKRQKVLKEIDKCIECFYKMIDDICMLSTDESAKNLADMRNELQESFNVVKRTKTRIAELENRSENV